MTPAAPALHAAYSHLPVTKQAMHQDALPLPFQKLASHVVPQLFLLGLLRMNSTQPVFRHA